MEVIKTSQAGSPARFGVVAAVITWAAAVGVGVVAMARYETTPGAPASAPRAWPAGAPLARGEDRPTLVMFAHPRCPCTRASIAQLAEIMVGASRPAMAYVLFYMPHNADASWLETDAWRSASVIPGVQAIRDEGGTVARRFGASTSGQVLVFDATGSLVFDGGITGVRGQMGDNVGSSAVATLLRRESAPAKQTPVFGCDLFAPTTCPLCGRKEGP